MNKMSNTSMKPKLLSKIHLSSSSQGKKKIKKKNQKRKQAFSLEIHKRMRAKTEKYQILCKNFSRL